MISCVGFQKIDGSDLEDLVSDVDLVISESPSSSKSLSLEEIRYWWVYESEFSMIL